MKFSKGRGKIAPYTKKPKKIAVELEPLYEAIELAYDSNGFTIPQLVLLDLEELKAKIRLKRPGYKTNSATALVREILSFESL